jgi:hypothetical protein
MIPSCLFLLFTILESNIHVRVLFDIFNEHGEQVFWNLFFFFLQRFCFVKRGDTTNYDKVSPIVTLMREVTNLKT